MVDEHGGDCQLEILALDSRGRTATDLNLLRQLKGLI